MAKKIKLTCDVGDDLLKVIGEVAVTFGQLEHVLSLSIKRTRPTMSLLEAQRLTDGITGRTEEAREAFEVWIQDQELEGKFSELMKELREVAARRNDVFHALWGKDAEGRVIWLRKSQYINPSLASLQKLRDDIRYMTARVDGATYTELLETEVPSDPN